MVSFHSTRRWLGTFLRPISSSGEDKVLALILPVPVASLTLDLSGSPFDTVMQLRYAALFAAGVLACPTGTTCMGVTPTCQ